MKEVETDVEVLSAMPREKAYTLVELAGRTAYKSEHKITSESSRPFIKALIARRHESVLEHVNVTVRYITDRATTHAIVRHRIAAYTQESTIYCDYKKAGEIEVRRPFFLMSEAAIKVWQDAILYAEHSYLKLRALGVPAGSARDVLPNALKTELVATHNIREWRHIFKERSAPGDSHGMHLLMAKTYAKLSQLYPLFFEDLDLLGQGSVFEAAMYLEQGDYYVNNVDSD